MIIRIPQQLVAALEHEVEDERAPLPRQVAALEELFGLFTHAKSRLRGTVYLDIPRFRAAYLRYHVPLNYARAVACLNAARRALPEIDALRRVVDIGAGPGSASLASLVNLPLDPQREYALVDRSRAALAVARRLSTAIRPAEATPAPAVTTNVASLPRLPRIDGPGLVWLAMVLNELRVGERRGPSPEDFADRITAMVAPGSTVLIVEPAQRGAGRNLLRVHDAMAASGGWRVLAPCTHAEPCPLLSERSRPWCHFHFHWEMPEWVRKVAEPTGLVTGKGLAKGSLAFLAVQRTERPLGERRGKVRRARVIGDEMGVRDGERGIYACGSGKRLEFVPRGVKMRRGDIVETDSNGRQRVALAWGATEAETGAAKSGATARPPARRRERGASDRKKRRPPRSGDRGTRDD